MHLHSYVPYMCRAGSFAAVLSGLHTASLSGSSGASVGTSLLDVQCSLLSHWPVPTDTDGEVPVEAIPVAVVSIAVVSVSYSVIYQCSVLVLTELADQLGFQS